MKRSILIVVSLSLLAILSFGARELIGAGKGHHAPVNLTATNDPAGGDAESELWPPNHKPVPVSVTVPEADRITGVAVFSNQAIGEIGSGNTDDDATGFPPSDGNTTAGKLIAERSGAAKDENGAHLPRVYLIVIDYEYEDESGQTQSDQAAVSVYVPHDMGKKKQEGFKAVANQAEADGDNAGASPVTPIPILLTGTSAE